MSSLKKTISIILISIFALCLASCSSEIERLGKANGFDVSEFETANYEGEVGEMTHGTLSNKDMTFNVFETESETARDVYFKELATSLESALSKDMQKTEGQGYVLYQDGDFYYLIAYNDLVIIDVSADANHLAALKDNATKLGFTLP